MRKLLKEEVKGIDTFFNEIKQKHSLDVELEDFLKKFIEESKCQRINFSGFNIPALGLALDTGVLINKTVLNMSLPMLCFVILHETAHQYQFKKYGSETMYECYIGEITNAQAADFMKKTEIVADEFASRKIRQLQKMGYFEGFNPPEVYKNIPIFQIEMMVNQYRQMIKKNKISSPEKISEFFYNMVKKDL
jgi:hypothetical protein